MLMRAAPAGAGGFEVFVQRRVPTMAFAAGMTVFPGGAREGADPNLAATAVRELLEETGVGLEASALVPWARWVTPVGQRGDEEVGVVPPRLADGADPVASGTEMDTVTWLTPAAALAAYDSGEVPMMAPTVITLRELAEYADIASVLSGAASRTLDPIRPKILDDEEGIRIELPGGEVFG